MALIKCPECGRENVSDSAEACPYCGFGVKKFYEHQVNLLPKIDVNEEVKEVKKIGNNHNLSKYKIKKSTVIIVAIFVIFVVGFFVINNKVISNKAEIVINNYIEQVIKPLEQSQRQYRDFEELNVVVTSRAKPEFSSNGYNVFVDVDFLWKPAKEYIDGKEVYLYNKMDDLRDFSMKIENMSYGEYISSNQMINIVFYYDPYFKIYLNDECTDYLDCVVKKNGSVKITYNGDVMVDREVENTSIESDVKSSSGIKRYCEADSCLNEGTYSIIGFSGDNEYYCRTHYQEMQDIISYMEESVGSGSASKHTCESCSKEGTHSIVGFSGQIEYYCTEHYNEMIEILKMLLDE